MRNVALLATRLVIGGYLAVHGAQKLFGAFGGRGLDRTGGGLPPDRPAAGPHMAAAAGISELGGGLLTAAGIADPAGPLAIMGTMAVAATTHRAKGPLSCAGRVRTSAHQPGRGRHARRGGTRPVPPRPLAAAAAGPGAAVGGALLAAGLVAKMLTAKPPAPESPAPAGQGSADQGSADQGSADR